MFLNSGSTGVLRFTCSKWENTRPSPKFPGNPISGTYNALI
jgi:hypothetical protein